MDDTERPDPILAQVPLIQNPAYQPPKPITLSNNYEKLIPSMSKSSIPPKFNLTKSSLDSWLVELNTLKEQAGSTSEDIGRFDQWIKSQQRKVAPGFDTLDGVMQPSKREPTAAQVVDKDVNELDKVFGQTTL